MEARLIKRLAIAAIPLSSLAFASWGSATVMTLKSVLWAPAFANGIRIFDCAHSVSGRRAHFNSHVTALDACGQTFEQWLQVADSFQTGATQATQFDSDSIPPRGCGAVTQHRSHLYSDVITGTGQQFFQYGTSADTGCWNSNVNTGQCTGMTAATLFSSSTSETTGACTNHVIQAVSAGTTP